MSLKDRVVSEVERLPETDLQYVADYLAFLKFRARRGRVSVRLPDSAILAARYAEFGDEDRLLAEDGIADYADRLSNEDNQ